MLAPSSPHNFNEETITRQHLVQVALGRKAADLIIGGATVLNVHSLEWKENWDIVISGQRIAWTGPAGAWPGEAKETFSAQGLWAVPGFGEAHKHIESTMLSPEYEADLVLRFGTTWNVEASHEFSNVNGARNVEFWKMARAKGSPFKIFPSLGSATPPTAFEESGGYYGYREIRDFMVQDNWVTGIDEVMDWSAVINQDNPGHQRIWENLQAALEYRGIAEGHGFGLVDLPSICAFAATGISGDHELMAGEETWDKLERGIFVETRPASASIWTYLLKRGLKDWSNVCVTTDDRNADTTLKRGAMDHNIRSAIEHGVPPEIAYALGSYNTARHFRIDHLVGSITPGRFADVVLLSDPKKLVIEAVFADGKKVSERGRMLVPVPKIDWPTWATKTVNFGGRIKPDHFVVRAPAGRSEVTAALMTVGNFSPEFPTATLQAVEGSVQRDEAQGITKVAMLDRYSGKTRVSKMFWQHVGTKTPDSAMGCTIAHDNHNAWVTGSSDAAMALAANTMAEMDGGYVLVREGEVAATLRLEIGGMMTARSAEAFSENLQKFREVMEKMDWMQVSNPFERFLKDFLGVTNGTEALIYGFLTCPPWIWIMIPPTDAVPEGFLNNRTGKTHPVVW